MRQYRPWWPDSSGFCSQDALQDHQRRPSPGHSRVPGTALLGCAVCCLIDGRRESDWEITGSREPMTSTSRKHVQLLLLVPKTHPSPKGGSGDRMWGKQPSHSEGEHIGIQNGSRGDLRDLVTLAGETRSGERVEIGLTSEFSRSFGFYCHVCIFLLRFRNALFL